MALAPIQRTKFSYLADCEIVASNNVQFCAHKIILASASDFFAELFQASAQGNSANSTAQRRMTTIHLLNCDPKSVESVLDFIYGSQNLDLNACDSSQISKIARACKIKSLEALFDCENHQPSGLRSHSAERRANASLGSYPTPSDPQNMSKSDHSSVLPDGFKSFAKRLCPSHFVFGCCCSKSTSAESLARTVAGCSTTTSEFRTKCDARKEVVPNVSPDETNGGCHSGISRCLEGGELLPPADVCSGQNVPVHVAKRRQKSQGVSAQLPAASPKRCRLTDASAPESSASSSAQCNSASVAVQAKVKDAKPSSGGGSWQRNKKFIKEVSNGYSCTLCKKSFVRYKSACYHIKARHRNVPVKCSHEGCSFSTREPGYIHFHKFYRHSTPLPENIQTNVGECPFCKHVSKTKGSMERHIRAHLSASVCVGGSYECEYCKKLFQSQGQLCQHVAVHTSTKAFFCSKCPYRARSLTNLKQHVIFKHPTSSKDADKVKRHPTANDVAIGCSNEDNDSRPIQEWFSSQGSSLDVTLNEAHFGGNYGANSGAGNSTLPPLQSTPIFVISPPSYSSLMHQQQQLNGDFRMPSAPPPSPFKALSTCNVSSCGSAVDSLLFDNRPFLSHEHEVSAGYQSATGPSAYQIEPDDSLSENSCALLERVDKASVIIDYGSL